MITQEQLIAMGPEAHLKMYGDHYRAYVINKNGGYKTQARVNQRCMNALRALGTIADKDVRRLQYHTRIRVAVITAFLNGMALGDKVARTQSA